MSTVALAQAGQFFPNDRKILQTTLDTAWQAAGDVELPENAEVIISPHAGYRFCADVAARAYRSARPCSRVLLISPSHYESFEGMAVPSHGGYRTGVGPVPLDHEARQVLAQYVTINDTPHAREHGIETQIPMLAHWMQAPRVLPVVIGKAQISQITAMIQAWRRFAPEGLVVLSSDLSHQLSQDDAKEHDLQAAALIETARWEKITAAHACGWQGINGALALPRIAGLRAVRLGMTNSARTTKETAHTVGYGAWAFLPADGKVLQPRARRDALKVARGIVSIQLEQGRIPQMKIETFATSLRGYGGSFITWTKAGQLRGCIGTLVPHRPLIEDIAVNALKSALNDPRFPPVSAQELPELQLKIAILSNSAAMHFKDEADVLSRLRPHVDGVVLSDGNHRATFLPMVWENLQTPQEFLRALKRKAGLPEDYWSDTLRISRYQAESFSE